MKRDLYEVVPNRMAFGLLGWKLTRRGYASGHKRKLVLFVHKNKRAVEKEAVDEANFWWGSVKWPAEVVIKNKWGRIQRKDTYGLDPEKIKG